MVRDFFFEMIMNARSVTDSIIISKYRSQPAFKKSSDLYSSKEFLGTVPKEVALTNPYSGTFMPRMSPTIVEYPQDPLTFPEASSWSCNCRTTLIYYLFA